MARGDAVLAALGADADTPLGAALARWLRERAFLAFAEAHASKIRRKVRQAGTPEEAADLRCELAAARGFLLDARCAVTYEPLRAGGGRSPDLRVVFRGHTAVNVEVTRQRPGAGLDPAARLARVLMDKTGQLQPGEANLLVLVDALGAVPEALRRIEHLPPLAARAAAMRGWPRLSAVLLASLTAEGLAAQTLWPNPQARWPLPPDLARRVAGWR